jgi:hypothetical protein
MANKSNTVCRNIVETKDVLKNQLASTLVESLVASNTITQQQCTELANRANACIDTQMDGLVDRVLKAFQD